MQGDLVVAADGADGAAVSGAEDGAVGRCRALAANCVVSRRAGTGGSVAVRAEIAGIAAHDELHAGLHLYLEAVLVPGVRRRSRSIIRTSSSSRIGLSVDAFFLGFECRLLVAHLLVMVSLALALCVVSGVAFALDSAVWRARPARPTRQVTAGRIAKSHAAHARLAQSIL